MIWWTDNIIPRQWFHEVMEDWIAASHQSGLPEPQEQALSLPQPPAILEHAQMLQYEAAPHWAPIPPQAPASQWHSQGIGTVPDGIGMGVYPSNR